MKRIVVFLATNSAILIVLSITMHILGVDQLRMDNGSDLNLTAQGLATGYRSI